MLVQAGAHVALVHGGRLRQVGAFRPCRCTLLLPSGCLAALPCQVAACQGCMLNALTCPRSLSLAFLHPPTHPPTPPLPQTWDLEAAATASSRAVPAILEVSPPLLLASSPALLHISGINLLQTDCQLLLRLQARERKGGVLALPAHACTCGEACRACPACALHGTA